MITTRIVQSTFKKTLYDLLPGTDVNFFGPVGRFIFNEEEEGERVFIAGGIGSTPFHSILHYIAEKNLLVPVTLFASFSTVEDLLFYDDFTKLSEEHPNIKIVYTVTKPEMSKHPWEKETGRITDEVITKYVPNITDCITYTCGPMPMVKGTVEILTNLGVEPENIRKENFIGY